MGVGGVWKEPGLTKLCVAGWTAEDGIEVEEEAVVEEEEEEESGSLDEEEIKKMQSDEVCGDILLWYPLGGHRLPCGLCIIPFSTLPLSSRAQQAWR